MPNRKNRAPKDIPSSGRGGERIHKKARPGTAEAGAERAAAQAAEAQNADTPAPDSQLPAHNIGGTGRPRSSGTPKPATANGAPATSRFSRFTPKQIRNSVLIGSLILVLILALVLAALLPGCLQNDIISSSSGSMSLFSSSSLADDSYDQTELEIPVGKYADTILPETEDAGDEYVEETLFLGDSNTARMLLFQDVTNVSMKNGIGIESMGITSVLGLRCVRFSGMADCTMAQAVAIMQPRRIVINFGTNNAGMNVDSFITSYKAAAKAIHDAYPSADIIIASVFPVSKGTTYGSVSQKGIDEFNLALVEMAQDEGYKFLNWSEALKGADGYSKSGRMDRDGVHLNATGMQDIFGYFRTHSYITEDTRPKPLKAIPARLPTPEGLFPKPESSSSGSSGSGSDSLSTSSSSVSSSSSSSAASSSSQAPSSSQEVSVAPSSSSSQPPATVTVPAWDSAGGEWSVSFVDTPTEGITETVVTGQNPAAGTQIAADAAKVITVYRNVPKPAEGGGEGGGENEAE